MPVVVQDEDGVAMGTGKVSQLLKGPWQREGDEVKMRAPPPHPKGEAWDTNSRDEFRSEF